MIKLAFCSLEIENEIFSKDFALFENFDTNVFTKEFYPNGLLAFISTKNTCYQFPYKSIGLVEQIQNEIGNVQAVLYLGFSYGYQINIEFSPKLIEKLAKFNIKLCVSLTENKDDFEENALESYQTACENWLLEDNERFLY